MIQRMIHVYTHISKSSAQAKKLNIDQFLVKGNKNAETCLLFHAHIEIICRKGCKQATFQKITNIMAEQPQKYKQFECEVSRIHRTIQSFINSFSISTVVPLIFITLKNISLQILYQIFVAHLAKGVCYFQSTVTIFLK